MSMRTHFHFQGYLPASAMLHRDKWGAYVCEGKTEKDRKAHNWLEELQKKVGYALRATQQHKQGSWCLCQRPNPLWGDGGR